MIINKNKLKLIPIFNKSLKEIYTNKKYDMIHLYSLLKEEIGETVDLTIPQIGNNIEQLADENYFYLKHEKDPQYIHIFKGSLDNDKKIINPIYIYSYNQKLFTDLDDKFKNIIKKDVYKLNNKQPERVKKLLFTNIIEFINEKLNNGLFNNKTSFNEVIIDINENNEQQFNFFIDKLNKKHNIILHDESLDNGNSSVRIYLKSINSDFKKTSCVINYNFTTENNKQKIHLSKKQIKIFFDKCISEFMEFSKKQDIQIVETNQNLIDIKVKKIASFYTDDFDKLLFEILKANKQSLETDFRKTPSNIAEAITILNDTNSFSFTKNLLGKGGGQGNVKGKGELSVHLMLNTTNVCTSIEPDAIIKTNDGEIKCSIKYFSTESSTVQTGQKMQRNIKDAYNNFCTSLRIEKLDFNNLFNVLYTILKSNNKTNNIVPDTFKSIFSINALDIKQINIPESINLNIVKDRYKTLKKEIANEHHTDYIIYLKGYEDNKFDYIVCSDIDIIANNLQISALASDRFSFRTKKLTCVTENYRNIKNLNYNAYNNMYARIETILGYILLALDNNRIFINKIKIELDKIDTQQNNQQTDLNANTVSAQKQYSGYKRKGMTLKEVFKNLH